MADLPEGAIAIRVGAVDGLAPGTYVVCVGRGCPPGKGVDATAVKLPDGAKITLDGPTPRNLVEACKQSAPQLAQFLAPLVMRHL